MPELSAADIQQIIQGVMSGSQIFLSAERIEFEKGQYLLDWVADAKTQLLPGEVVQ